MDGLRKLEQVQRMLSLLHRRGLASGHPQPDRFLSEFILFMIQSYGELSVEEKCRLVSKTLSMMSISIFEEAERIVINDSEPLENGKESIYSVSSPGESCEVQPLKILSRDFRFRPHDTNFQSEPMIGLDAMERANSTLEDFCKTYFMFHGMDINDPGIMFKYLPLLSFTEGYIYQLDTMNEKISSISVNGDLTMKNGNQGRFKPFVEAFQNDPFRHVCNLFDSCGLLTERLKEEFNHGSEYWSLERKLCHQLTTREEISVEDVMRAIHLKSFDYRVLNLLLYHLRKEQVNEEHMEFLFISEFLVEISDDLYDYEDDVLENNFNILRMFVGLYGASEAPRMLAKCIGCAEEKHKKLSNNLDPKLSQLYWKRCEEATGEGGNASDIKLGSWNLPQIIVDEELYRSRFSKNERRCGNSRYLSAVG